MASLRQLAVATVNRAPKSLAAPKRTDAVSGICYRELPGAVP